jgi:hypothetical protein
MDKYSAIRSLQFNKILIPIMSFMTALCSGCMFLKQDILYAGAVKHLNLKTFSLLWTKP